MTDHAKKLTQVAVRIDGGAGGGGGGSGDVVGPASATDGAAALFDGTTGKLLKDSKVILTVPASAATLTLGSGKTTVISNSITFAGTDATVMTFPTTSATIARIDAANTFTGTQTFSGEVRTATVNNSGGTLALQASSVTKVSVGSSAVFFVVPPYPNSSTVTLGASGGNEFFEAYIKQAIQGSNTKNLTESTPTDFVRISVASGSYVGGSVKYTIYAADATDQAAISGEFYFSAVNKAGTITAVGTTPSGVVENAVAATSGSTLSNTFTIDTTTTANNIQIEANAVSSLTQTTLLIRYFVFIHSGTATVTAL